MLETGKGDLRSQASFACVNETFDEFVYSIGFQVSAFDPCLYIKVTNEQCVLISVCVDDVLVTGHLIELIARTKNKLKIRFEMTDSGNAHLS